MSSRKYLTAKEGERLRIFALKDFGNVKSGEMGGLIENERNLSHEGNCWVGEYSIVDNDGRISGNAQVLGESTIQNALIYGDAVVENSDVMGGIIYGNVTVYNSDIFGNPKIFGTAKLTHATIADSPVISGNCSIEKGGTVSWHASICGNAEVHGAVGGMAQISGSAVIGENAYISGKAIVTGKAFVKGHAQVYDNAIISESATLTGNVIIRGNAKIMDNADISGTSVIEGDARIYHYATVCGNSKISGNAIIKECAAVNGADIAGDAVLLKTSDHLVFHAGEYNQPVTVTRSDKMIKTSWGFYGSLSEFSDKVQQYHDYEDCDYKFYIKMLGDYLAD